MHIFRYNKQDRLTDFVSKNDNGQINHLICLKNNTLLKLFNENVIDDDSNYREISVFKEDICLKTFFLMGEYWIKPTQKENDALHLKTVKIDKALFLATSDSEITNFSVGPEHTKDWSKKLGNI